MGQKTISIRLHETLKETSNKLQSLTLEENELAFFKIHAGSQNSWNSFVYEMGLIKVQQDFEKFKQLQDTEIKDETKNCNDK